MYLCVGNAYKVAKNGVDFIRMLWYNNVDFFNKFKEWLV